MAVVSDRFQKLYERVDQLSGGTVSILRYSATRFLEMGGMEAAASLAYFALFSLFPLTLFLVALLGSILENEFAYQQALAFVRTIFPFSGAVVERSLSEVLERRGTIGFVGLLGALWSATGFFNTLGRSVNRAWPTVKLRGLVHGRLIALGMIGAMISLLLLSLLSSTLLNLLPVLINFINGSAELLGSAISRVLLRIVPAFFTLLMFTGLYRWVPNKTVSWKAVLKGSLVTTISWELAKSVFTFYLRSGLARYEFIYGSLGTLIALMVWIYLSNVIALFGAYLVATLDIRDEQARDHEESKKRPRSPVERSSTKGLHG